MPTATLNTYVKNQIALSPILKENTQFISNTDPAVIEKANELNTIGKEVMLPDEQMKKIREGKVETFEQTITSDTKYKGHKLVDKDGNVISVFFWIEYLHTDGNWYLNPPEEDENSMHEVKIVYRTYYQIGFHQEAIGKILDKIVASGILNKDNIYLTTELNKRSADVLIGDFAKVKGENPDLRDEEALLLAVREHPTGKIFIEKGFNPMTANVRLSEDGTTVIGGIIAFYPPGNSAEKILEEAQAAAESTDVSQVGLQEKVDAL